jgi:hypothetical protein
MFFSEGSQAPLCILVCENDFSRDSVVVHLHIVKGKKVVTGCLFICMIVLPANAHTCEDYSSMPIINVFPTVPT